MDPHAARLDVVARLASIDVKATTDPAKLNPPDVAVLVEACQLTGLRTGCVWDATITVWLCAPPSGAAEALEALEARLMPVAAALRATAATHTTKSHGSTTWPAYQLTAPATVTT